jgi:uncharacterized protein
LKCKISKKSLLILTILPITLSLHCGQEQLEEDFLKAIKKNDLTTIEKYIQDGAQVNKQAKKGFTPLSRAIRASSSNVVELLLKCGADSCQATKQGSIPLTLAINIFKENNDSLRKIQLLLNNGANANQQNGQGRTPLMKAIGKKQQTIVQLCIQHGANTNMPDSSGSFPLLLATQKKCIGIIRLLLANHADPNQETNSITPLKLALEIGDIPIAQLLVQHHANVNQQAKGVTLLAEFIKRQITPNVEFLLNVGADPYKESTIQTKEPGISEEKTALEMADETKNKKIIALIKDAIREKQKGTAETIMKIREEVDPDVARTIEEY